MEINKSQFRVYLAGGITGLSYGEATDWRAKATEELAKYGIEGVSPMRGKAHLKNETNITNQPYKNILSTEKGILNRDRFDTMRADVLLVNLYGAEKPSIGTMIELGWADSARIPVIMIAEKGGVHDHVMVNGIVTYRVDTLEEGLAILKTLLVAEDFIPFPESH